MASSGQGSSRQEKTGAGSPKLADFCELLPYSAGKESLVWTCVAAPDRRPSEFTRVLPSDSSRGNPSSDRRPSREYLNSALGFRSRFEGGRSVPESRNRTRHLYCRVTLWNAASPFCAGTSLIRTPLFFPESFRDFGEALDRSLNLEPCVFAQGVHKSPLSKSVFPLPRTPHQISKELFLVKGSVLKDSRQPRTATDYVRGAGSTHQLYSFRARITVVSRRVAGEASLGDGSRHERRRS